MPWISRSTDHVCGVSRLLFSFVKALILISLCPLWPTVAAHRVLWPIAIVPQSAGLGGRTPAAVPAAA